MKFSWLAAFAAVACVLAGCGGGSASSGAMTSNLKLGQASVTYSGSAQPFVAQGSGSITVTGMCGASYSNLSLFPTKSLNNTCLLYGDSAGIVWTCTPSGAPFAQINNSGSPMYAGAFTNDGHLLVAVENSGGQFTLCECNYDGSGLTQLFSTPIDPAWGFACSPNNTKVAWLDSTDKLWISNLNGTSPVQLASQGFMPAFSPDGNTVAFAAYAGNYVQIYTVPSTGGTATKYPGQDAIQNYMYPSWLPGGAGIGCEVSDSGVNFICGMSSSGNLLWEVQTPDSSPDDVDPSLAPDGKTIAFERDGYLTTSLFNGADASEIATSTYGGTASGLRWSPYPSPQTFVGNVGTMFGSAAGFLWGQNGTAFASLLVFTSSAPSSATITPEAASSGYGYMGGASGALVFDIHAKSITGLKFTNGYYAQVTTVIPGGASAQSDALVSFDASSGSVSAIAPFIATRGALKPEQQGDSLTFDARFLGVWDGKGKNLAPQGASEVTIDRKTGKMLRLNP